MNKIKQILDLGIIDESVLLDTVATLFPPSENKSVRNDLITEALSIPCDNNTESDLRKLFTAASKIAQEKGLDGFPKIGNLATAVISDNIFTVAKTSYLIATGEISTDTVAEIVADKAAVVCDCIASVVTPDTVRSGLDRLVDVISIVTSHPEMQMLKAYTSALSYWIAPAVQDVIMDGKKILSTAIRDGIARAAGWLKTKAGKIVSQIPLLAK